jgi:prepilin-type N-terminal cleavage/methylation domain-containing protein
MMRRLQRENGFTLVEVLISTSVLVIVLGATLGTMTQFDTKTRANQLQNDAQETARAALDQVSRELRNHGVPLPNAVGIRKLGSYDIVFQTVDNSQPAGSLNTRNVKWARYCLDSSVASNEKLWASYYTWNTASPPASIPSTTSCPDPAWSGKRVVADNLFNRNAGLDRPFFTANSSDPASVSRIGLTAYVNANRGGNANAATREARLDTSVALRNENRSPVGDFTMVLSGTNHLVLNASGSSDPDGDPMTFQWSYDGTVIPSADGVTLGYDTPTTSGSHTVTLTVTDSGGQSSVVTHTINLDTGGVS